MTAIDFNIWSGVLAETATRFSASRWCVSSHFAQSSSAAPG
jgi:hypothetical protein